MEPEQNSEQPFSNRKLTAIAAAVFARRYSTIA
jgi:hypothetical protein